MHAKRAIAWPCNADHGLQYILYILDVEGKKGKGFILLLFHIFVIFVFKPIQSFWVSNIFWDCVPNFWCSYSKRVSSYFTIELSTLQVQVVRFSLMFDLLFFAALLHCRDSMIHYHSLGTSPLILYGNFEFIFSKSITLRLSTLYSICHSFSPFYH